MNKRIKELAEQADIKFRISSIDPQFWSDKEESLEKFAELIVRECVSTLDEADGSVHHRECLFDHFGVRE